MQVLYIRRKNGVYAMVVYFSAFLILLVIIWGYGKDTINEYRVFLRKINFHGNKFGLIVVS